MEGVDYAGKEHTDDLYGVGECGMITPESRPINFPLLLYGVLGHFHPFLVMLILSLFVLLIDYLHSN